MFCLSKKYELANNCSGNILSETCRVCGGAATSPDRRFPMCLSLTNQGKGDKKSDRAANIRLATRSRGVYLLLDVPGQLDTLYRLRLVGQLGLCAAKIPLGDVHATVTLVGKVAGALVQAACLLKVRHC